MDTLYARNKTLVFDMKLLLLTVPAVLFAERLLLAAIAKAAICQSSLS